MEFDDILKLSIELTKRGAYPYNIIKAIRYFSDGVIQEKNNDFVVFNYNNKEFLIKVIPVVYNGYGNLNSYKWILA